MPGWGFWYLAQRIVKRREEIFMPTKLVAWMLSFLSFFAFWKPTAQPNSIPEARKPPASLPDYSVWPTNSFETAKAPLLWGDGLELLFSAKGLFNSGHQNDSLLVLHKGKIVYERYGAGYDKDTPHPVYSVTKSVTSALVGIAIGEGKSKACRIK
jgi:hypothetical protein